MIITNRQLYMIYTEIKAMDESYIHIDCLHHASAVRTGDLTPQKILVFQHMCFLRFVGKRALKLLINQKFKLIKNFFRYYMRGRKNNVPLWYRIGYFLICCEDNLIN